jgi:8-oxo-dGTP pyrophosphatase MutT (NUDIX family)
MSVRSRIAGTLTRAAQALGGQPQTMREAAETASQMGTQHQFSPGEPIRPHDGYSRHPRAHDFVTGYNIATRPRTHERVSFDTLRGLIEAYDVAQIAIWHRIDSIRSLDWKLIAADGYGGDVTDAIPAGMAALRKPDRVTSFEAWLAKWLWDVLAYDAGSLYRMRNRGGRCVGLSVVDGTLIAPLLDYWGNSPEEPAEAYVQYINGLPWNWLTRGDLIYEPFRPRANSPYGHAPLESIILNANTDIRFQIYFLERFTEGNIPEAFAAAPETWSPDQIEQFQEYWDSFMYGDQSRKHQIRWMPGGSTIAWSNEKDFSDAFSLHMMRKSCAAYHVVPSDLGFTESVNRSSGESQADVQHRVGDLPLGHYIERVVTSFLQDDLGLPLQHKFDWGEEQDDRYQQAQADEVYLRNAVVGASEIREMRFGLAEPAGQVVPRVFFTERAGPIPLASLYAVAGKVDPQTAAPDPGAPLPRQAFAAVPGVLPAPAMREMPLAEREFGPAALPPAPAPQPGRVEKDGDGGPTVGITTDTGVYGYDLAGQDEDDDEDSERERAEEVRKEMAAFRRFERARRRSGAWRDFTFAAVAPVPAHRLNDAGRLVVRKAAGQVAVAGLAVLAEDTGRVLMLQRALGEDDPAGGTWEFPGGHLEDGETPLRAARREWAEETGCVPPPGAQTGSWVSADGVYQGIVWTVPSEDCVPVRADTEITNPDDPDGDQVEAIAWWDPEHIPGNPSVRQELLASTDDVMAALGTGEPVEKAGAGPKGQPPSGGAQQQPQSRPTSGAAREAAAVSAAAQVAAVFAAAELAILKELAELVAKVALGALTASAAWERLRDIAAKATAGARRDAQAVLGKADASVRVSAERVIRDDLAHLPAPVLDKALAAAASATTPEWESLQSVLERAGMAALRQTADVYQQVIGDVMQRVTAAGTAQPQISRLEAAQQALNEFAAKGITGFTDERGRNWDLTSYTEMATRTAASRLHLASQLAAMGPPGFDLVIVDNPTRLPPCEMCRPLEGQVLSLTGVHPPGSEASATGADGREHTAHVLMSLTEARAAGLFHPACRHSLSPFTDGAGFLPLAGGDERGYIEHGKRVSDPLPIGTPDDYDAEQKLRARERAIRRERRLLAVASTPQARDRARRRVADAERRLEGHLTRHPALMRNRRRERIGRAR